MENECPNCEFQNDDNAEKCIYCGMDFDEFYFKGREIDKNTNLIKDRIKELEKEANRLTHDASKLIDNNINSESLMLEFKEKYHKLENIMARIEELEKLCEIKKLSEELNDREGVKLTKEIPENVKFEDNKILDVEFIPSKKHGWVELRNEDGNFVAEQIKSPAIKIKEVLKRDRLLGKLDKKLNDIKTENKKMIEKIKNPYCSICGEIHTPKDFVEKHGEPDMSEFVKIGRKVLNNEKQEIVPAGEIIKNILNVKISTELKDFLYDFDDDALLEKTYQINKFDNVEEILYLRYVTRDIIEKEAFKKVDKQLKNIEQISLIVKEYFEKLRSNSIYFFRIDSCELSMDKKWIVKCRFLTNPFHNEEVKYTVIVEENGDIFKVEKEEKTYRLISNNEKNIPFLIDQKAKDDFIKLMEWTEDEWNNHTREIKKSEIEELKRDAELILTHPHEELEKRRLKNEKKIEELKRDAEDLNTYSQDSDNELKRLNNLRQRRTISDKDETVLLSALNDFYHEGTDTTHIMELIERMIQHKRNVVEINEIDMNNEKFKLFHEINWIYHRLSNYDLILLKEFIDKHLKETRQDEKQKIFAELEKLKTYSYPEIDVKEGIVCWKDIEKLLKEELI